MGVDLPTGLSGAWHALTYGHDSRLAHDRLTSLVWLRQITDPTCPEVAGHDPRRVLDDPIPWETPWDGEILDVLGERLNEVMGYPGELLSTDWRQLPSHAVERAVAEVRRWRPEPHVGDQLGYVSQRVRYDKAARGEFYTPYTVSLAMATMAEPGPGESVLDPCCGSGSMLLAAIEACRRKHGVDKVPEVYGIDINPVAVRLCRLNLALAGIHPKPRVECRDALLLPAEQLTPVQQKLQEALFEYEGATAVSWREREA